MNNQRKHVTQMTQAERDALERFAHAVPTWCGLSNAHIAERKVKWNVSNADILNALWHGEPVEAHYNNAPDIRFVMRHVNNTRCVCVCASIRGEVITVWVNGIQDNHCTLDHTQYQWRVNLESVFNTQKG